MNPEKIFTIGDKRVCRDGGLLFILEIANNHQGKLEHGLKIIRSMGEIVKAKGVSAAIKFQFRRLESLIHPGYLRCPLSTPSNRHVRRFLETKLSFEDYRKMVDEIRSIGLIPLSTPFDEPSVDWCEALELPAIKIASCSASDWPLLKRIAKSRKPVVCSTGGLSTKEIDEVVKFFRGNSIPIALMHCVSIYPASRDRLQLDQIRQLRDRYPDLVVGYSGHESVTDLDIGGLAVACGASILERHVGLPAEDIKLNAYSLSPDGVAKWMEFALNAWEAMNAGNPRSVSETELSSLNELKRGVYVKVEKRPGEFLSQDDLFLSMPCLNGQFSAGEVDEVVGLPVGHRGMKSMMPVMKDGDIVIPPEIHAGIIAERTREMLGRSKITLPPFTSIEISHPKGIERFEEQGAVIIGIVNREYCKKLIIQFPGQHHPSHRHIQKEETFHVLAGEVEVENDGKRLVLKPGDCVTIKRGVRHAFSTRSGAILEEISTTHVKGDSFYDDPEIPHDPDLRKTFCVL